MKANTYLHAAIRNVGDSQDVGTNFEGPLKDCILWIATQLASMSMAGRIVIGIGRNQEDAQRGIQVNNAGRQKLTSSVTSLLDNLFEGVEFTDEDFNESAERDCTELNQSSYSNLKDPLDDYEG